MTARKPYTIGSRFVSPSRGCREGAGKIAAHVLYKGVPLLLLAHITETDDDPVRGAVPYQVQVVSWDNEGRRDVSPCWSERGNVEWLVEQAHDAGLLDEVADACG